MALPGCTLAIDHQEDYELIMGTFLKAIRKFIDEGEKDKTIGEIDLPDIPLWTIWAIQQFRRSVDSNACREKYGDDVRFLVEAIRSGRVPNLYLNHNGLLPPTARGLTACASLSRFTSMTEASAIMWRVCRNWPRR